DSPHGPATDEWRKPEQEIPSNKRQVSALEREPEASVLYAHLGAYPSEEQDSENPRQWDGDELAVGELIGVAVRELPDPDRHRPQNENVPDIARLPGEL